MSFKLLAIRPLEGCNKKFLKNLEINRIYKFYNDYEFILDKNQKEVIEIKHNPTVPEKLFYQQRENGTDLPINISAIVGKNGSGKSALVELLYVAFYNFAVENKIFKNLNNLKNEEKVFCEIFYCIKNESDKNYQFLKMDFNINNSIKILNLDPNSNFEPILGFDLFYNIISNYSLYGLNSEILENKWIEKIFHKNDGYEVPIVINPMRTKGIIDVNREYTLTKDRLLSTLLNDDFDENSKLMIKGKVVNGLILKLKSKSYFDDTNKKNEYLNKYLKLIFNSFKDDTSQSDIKDDFINEIINSNDIVINKATEYILYKLKKISDVYSKEDTSFKVIDYEKKDSISSFLKNIRNADFGSHITYKIRQVINFLSNDIHVKKESINYYDEDLQKLKKNIKNHLIKSKEKYLTDKNSENITYPFWLYSNMSILPPPIYEIDYEFEDLSKFSLLSSGETQKIFCISTILYHISNISSKHNNYLFADNKELKKLEVNLDKARKDIKYQNINLVLDEIELYAHPDMQRTFINDLIFKINSTYLKGIDSINIIFITHSPFILSDIPKQNVLFLNEGKPIDDFKRMNTFGANITDLLADSFFIGDGLIGDFAKEKIEETIDWLNHILKIKQDISKLDQEKNKRNIMSKNKKIEDLKKIELAENIKGKTNILYKYHYKIIQIVDEPILKFKLEEMYNEAVLNISRIELLQNKINDMQKEINLISKR